MILFQASSLIRHEGKVALPAHIPSTTYFKSQFIEAEYSELHLIALNSALIRTVRALLIKRAKMALKEDAIY